MDNALTMRDVEIIGSVLAAVLTACWALLGAIKAEFRRTRDESEKRTVRTHERIDKTNLSIESVRTHLDDRFDSLRTEIDHKYLPREVHAEAMRRVDQLSDFGEILDRLAK